MAKARRICPECGAKRFRKSDDGTIACKNGHIQSSWREEVSEVSEQRTTLRLQKGPKRGVTDRSEENTFLRGDNSAAVATLAVQFAYRALVRGIRDKLRLPESFEMMARELWLMYIRASKRELPETYNAKSRPPPPRRFSLDDLEELIDASERGEYKVDIFAKQEQESFVTDNAMSYTWPILRYYHSIVLCYLACKRFRLPVFLCDIHRWIHSLELPYLDIQAIVPAEFLRRLLYDGRSSFAYPGKMQTLYRLVDRYSQCFARHCGVVFEGNEELALIRCCGQLYCTVDEYLAAREMQRVLTCISFPGQSLAEVCAMVCALWAAQNNWIKFRKARKANFPRKEDLENQTRLWYPSCMQRFLLLKGNLEHWRKVNLALKPKVVQETEIDKAPKEVYGPPRKKSKRGSNARVEMLMKEISTEITETSKYVLQRVEPQDIIVPWDRPNLNLENDEYLADKKAPTREADVVLLSLAAEYLDVQDSLLRLPLLSMLSANLQTDAYS